MRGCFRMSAIIGIALSLYGCGLFGPPDEIKPWSRTSKELGYSITFPAAWGWFEETTFEFYAISPETDGASFHVRGTRVAGRTQDTTSLMGIAMGTARKIAQTHGYQTVVFPAESRDGRTVIPAVAIFTSEGISYTRETLFFEKGDFVGTIDFTGPSSRFSSDAEIQGVKASLRFF